MPISDKSQSFIAHLEDDMAASGRLYIGIPGVGVKLNVTVNFIKNS